MDDVADSDIPVYYGGPVQTDSIHFVHQYPHLIDDACKIAEEVYWGGNFETVKALLQNNELDPQRIKFFLGYSGWGSGQLTDELKEKSWLTVNTTKHLIFNTTPQQVWKKSLQHLGGEYEQLINYPLDPQLN
jgi:putative transcriptional regulator